MMLKEVLAQQTSSVSKLHVIETELFLLSKSKGKDSMERPEKWSNDVVDDIVHIFAFLFNSALGPKLA